MDSARRYDEPPRLQAVATLCGRILLSSIFLISALLKFADWVGTEELLLERGIVFAPLVVALSLSFELIGGLAILTGFLARAGAISLIAYLVCISFLLNNFWDYPPAEQALQMVMMLKNFAIMGGLLLVAAYGPGPLSIGSHKRE